MTREQPTLSAADILHSDRHLLVVNKAAGWLSQGDSSADPAVADFARRWLLNQLPESERQQRNPFVAPAHRLDRPVSGVLVLARTSKAAGRLTTLFQKGAIRKDYLAVVDRPVPDRTTVELYLHKDRRRNTVSWRTDPAPGHQFARTQLAVLQRADLQAAVGLTPETGRSHQLRATLASLGAPIVGDLRYGSSVGLGPYIALHARRLTFDHPVGGAQLSIEAPLPSDWLVRWPWIDLDRV